jgi:hypothetical protein
MTGNHAATPFLFQILAYLPLLGRCLSQGGPSCALKDLSNAVPVANVIEPKGGVRGAMSLLLRVQYRLQFFINPSRPKFSLHFRELACISLGTYQHHRPHQILVPK